jgi:hypothetical protein
LSGGHQSLPAADEVALRHFQPVMLRHPGPTCLHRKTPYVGAIL